MRKLLCFAALCAFMLPFANLVESTAHAQKGKAGTIVISEGKDGKFRFAVRDGAGKFLAGSAAYPSAAAAMKAVEEFKSVVAGAKVSTSDKKPAKDKGKGKGKSKASK